MRDQLRQYVELLFAGAQNCEDIKQEILQNTLDRYDDLIAEGKVPEAAYRLAITGIGDVNEILGIKSQAVHAPSAPSSEEDTDEKKRKRALAIALYILCPVPVLLMGSFDSEIFNIIGVCGLFILVAIATYLMVTNSVKDAEEDNPKKQKPKILKSIHNLSWAIGLAVYFVLSFATNAWYITWIIFPLIGAVNGLVTAIFDLKEANKQ